MDDNQITPTEIDNAIATDVLDLDLIEPVDLMWYTKDGVFVAYEHFNPRFRARTLWRPSTNLVQAVDYLEPWLEAHGLLVTFHPAGDKSEVTVYKNSEYEKIDPCANEFEGEYNEKIDYDEELYGHPGWEVVKEGVFITKQGRGSTTSQHLAHALCICVLEFVRSKNG